MEEVRVIKSTCGLCFTGCGILIHINGGRPVRVEGDPDSPVNRGILCYKAGTCLDHLFHPQRLKHPLKRTGNRGEGRWESISWDHALDLVSSNLREMRSRFGAESVAFIQGAAKGLQDTLLWRFANLFGSPNFVSQGYVCFLPRKFGSTLTLGFLPVPDYDHPPRCILVWGSNKAKFPEYDMTCKARERGARLMVIDPRETDLARKADTWIRIRPGTDLALALGMLHIIIREGLFDQGFVQEWTTGFKELKAHIMEYPPERVAPITWVAPEAIRNLARDYASNRPGCIQMGNALEHNRNSLQTVRAISMLKAVTGNIGVPGGELFRTPLPILERYAPELTLEARLPEEKKKLRLGPEGPLLPFFHHAPVPAVMKAMGESDPYRVRAAYIQGANPLLTWPNAREVRRSLMALDFLAVSDLFMTPTAALADLVLPSATFLEFDSVVTPPYYPIAQVQQKVAEIEEARPDFWVIRELSRRLGMGDSFWRNDRELLDFLLAGSGLDFESFRKTGALAGEMTYHHYLSKGFDTPSGKVEVYSRRLEEWGFDPLPIYREAPDTPLSDPDETQAYPLVFTSWKSEYYRHSAGRQIESLRERHPDPVVWIHPETAVSLGVREGDWVWVITRRGRIRQKTRVSSGLDRRVIGVDYGWWFPEMGEQGGLGWDQSNINILTDPSPPYNPELGSANLRGMMCRVEKDAPHL